MKGRGFRWDLDTHRVQRLCFENNIELPRITFKGIMGEDKRPPVERWSN